jgi:23S rRNA (adenine-N6)-dimethyltransferase
VGSPRQRWGWHQLDPHWAARLVADAQIPAGAIVVDVGAGLGAITRPLVDRGARVIAVEAHAARAERLRERFGDAIVVVQADAADLRVPRRPFYVVANPPFHVTAALLRRLVQPSSRLVAAHVIVQEWVARRWIAPHAPGYQRWNRVYVATLGARVRRQAFRPPPHLDCRVLVIRRRADGGR